MKRLISVTIASCLALAISGLAAVDSSQDDYAAAVAKAKKEKKLVMVDVYAPWCLPCKQLDKETFGNRDVGTRLSNQVVTVKLDLEKILNDANLAKQFAKDTIPYVVFLDSDGRRLSEFVGFLSPDDFLKELDGAIQKATKK
jgi:thiol:disulfide interchange protein